MVIPWKITKNLTLLLKVTTKPLKIDAWKMKCLFWMVYFQRLLLGKFQSECNSEKHSPQRQKTQIDRCNLYRNHLAVSQMLHVYSHSAVLDPEKKSLNGLFSLLNIRHPKKLRSRLATG